MASLRSQNCARLRALRRPNEMRQPRRCRYAGKCLIGYSVQEARVCAKLVAKVEQEKRDAHNVMLDRSDCLQNHGVRLQQELAAEVPRAPRGSPRSALFGGLSLAVLHEMKFA